MQKLIYQTQKICGVLFGLLILLTLFNSCLSTIRYGQSRNRLNEISSQGSSSPPELALAAYDGNDSSPDIVQTYAQLLDELETKCTEDRLQLAGIAAALTKRERELGETLTFRQGLRVFLYDVVDPAFQRREVSCLDAYVDYRQTYQ